MDQHLELDPSTLPNYDLHNHTVYCGHAEETATVPNLIARANDLGLDCLGFSEHVMNIPDLVYLRAMQMEVEDLGAASKADILFGVEMDVDPADPEGNWVVPDIDCDYVILSAHGFPQFDLEIPASDQQLPGDIQRRRLALRWLVWYGKAIRNGGAHILGHPLREPMNMGLLNLYDPELFQASLQAFQPAIDQGIAFELNNAFLGYLATTPNFAGYVQLIRFLRDRGMKFSRGSDSHSPAKVGACDGIGHVAEEAALTAADFLDPAPLLARRRW